MKCLVGVAARLLLPSLVLTAVLAPSALAHDVDVTGVARVFLDELPGGEYSLSVVDQQVPPLFDVSRILPPRCTGLPPQSFSYRFRCQPALDANDQLTFPWALQGVVLLANWQDGETTSGYFPGDGALVEVPMSGVKAGAGSLRSLATRYLGLGAEHILFGIDHLLFVLGLLLLQHSLWRVLQTITAFTVAHSITLGFAVLGILPVPNAPIEILIALSIVFLAREILTGLRGEQTLVHRQPWIVAFLFGLFHGFGFAGALGEIGLSRSDVPLALLFFNLGVEAGQIAFIAVLMLIYAVFYRLSRDLLPSLYRGLAYGLGCIATYWTLERLPSLLPV